jgi:VWFA-related protein
LSPDEIELREDDRLQKLSDVVRVVRPLPDFAAPLTVAARVPIAEGADVASNFGAADARIYALFLDDLHVDARRTLEVRNLARRFVQKYVAPGDQVAVVHASGRTDAAHGFTANRALLLAAIDQFSPRKVRPATVERYALYEDARRFDRRVGPQDLRDTSDAERARNALVALQTLQGVTTSLGRITGRRKAIVLISEGTDHDLSGVSNGPAMLGPISSRSPTLGGLMTGPSGPQIASALHAVVAYATRANVTVYAFDPRKGSIEDEAAQLRLKSGDPELRISELDLASEKQDAQSMLGGLAQQTGGVAILAGNYDQGFERLVRDGSDLLSSALHAGPRVEPER